MTRNLARLLLALPGLFITLTGTVFLLSPASAADKLLLGAQSAEALSNVRGMSGAPLLAVGLTLLLSAATARLEYARPAAIFLLTLLAARVLSYVVDGAPSSIALFLAVPATAFGFMLAGHVLLDRAAAEA
jgi:nitrate reductase gamma subunit